MKKLLIGIILGTILISCSSQQNEQTLTVDKIEIPYSMVEQSIDLDDSMSLDLYLQSGFDPNYINTNGETLLMQIVKNNSLRSLAVLLKYKIDVEEETVIKKQENTTSYEPTKRAIDFVKSKKALDLLINAGADVNYKDNLGDPLIIKFIKNRPIIYTEELISKKANLDVKDSSGWTPLIWATSKRNEELVNSLIKNNANINMTDDRGNSAIYYAYGENIIDLFLISKLDINLLNKDKENILGEVYLRSISNSYYSSIKKIIDLGIDKNYSSYGDTPLNIAKEKRDAKLENYLKDLGVKTKEELELN